MRKKTTSRNRLASVLTLLLTFGLHAHGQDFYEVINGNIRFKSNAPQENIEASSQALEGIVDITTNTFAFSIDINTLKGFNSALQEEHFYENYLQTDIYPTSTFSGKLIDRFNPDAAVQKIRAKGNLEIHGKKKERIIEIVLTKKGAKYLIESNFNVLLMDHDIRIPKIVTQKIAENINIQVKGELVKK